MKHIAILLTLVVVLTGCFGHKDHDHHDWSESGVVDDHGHGWENDEDFVVHGDEDGKDDESLSEIDTLDIDQLEQEAVPIEETTTAEEKKAEEEVLNEFESDLEDIFSDLGV